MDFRMDKASWAMIVFMIATMMYFIVDFSEKPIPASGYLYSFGSSIFLTLVMIALACIPVLIICYFIKRIPDIDYAVWGATAFTVVGIISEVIS